MNGNKTEKPTPKKIRDARQKGQVVRSGDLTGAFMFGVVVLVVVLFFGIFWGNWISLLRKTIEWGIRGDFKSAMSISRVWLTVLLKSVSCVLLVSVSLGFLMVFIQVGPLWSPVRVEWKRLDVSNGFKQILSAKKLVDLMVLLVKFLVVAVGAFFVGRWCVARAYILTNMTMWNGLSCVGSWVLGVISGGVVVLLCFGAFDYWLQRFRWLKDLMMSHHEVKKEFKEMEGDPEVKYLRKQLYQEMASGSLKDRVSAAAVVVVNPTRFAVALKYDPTQGHAPAVVAKGSYESAVEIRRIAIASGVPVVRFPPVARALFVLGIDESVPPEMYRAVAEVLVYVSRIISRNTSGGAGGKKNVKKLDKTSQRM